jgi:cyclic pyranopterin phosphate synthase
MLSAMSPFDSAVVATRRAPAAPSGPLVDPFGRAIDYLRVSVTDRCDLRCVYCMSERQTFLPKTEVLSIEELDRLCSAFIGLGTRKLRLTGGEPLTRRGFMDLVKGLSRHLKSGALDELTLTTNGTRLAEHADELARLGVRRLNVSLDSLDPATFHKITRGGQLSQVLAGIEAARAAGLGVKINTVALKNDNAHDLPAIIDWAHGRDLDITLIETMPMGEVEEDRTDQYLPLSAVRADLESFWTLTPLDDRTAGPARYVRVEDTGGRLGFITPLTHNFCESCNRVRVTCTGALFMCLGQDDQADLRTPMRDHPGDDAPLIAAIREAMDRKPKGHDFEISRRGAAPAVHRPMSMTGG